ncbi:MAG: MFS transporter [Firmicutes bacterium]|nr:MFS transporter [Bacillota bacterium]
MATSSRAAPTLGRLTLGLAFLMFIMGSDLNVVAPLLVSMSRSFHAPVSSIGWTITLFALGYALASPAAGSASDRLGRLPTLFSGIVCFVVAESLSGLAPTLPTELLARTFAGMAAGAVSPIAYALVGDLVPESSRAGAMAVLSMGFSLATVAGVPLGLWLSEAVGWRGTLLAIGGALLVNASLLLPSLRSAAGGRRPHPFRSPAHSSRRLGVLAVLDATWPQLLASFAAFCAIGLVYTYLPTVLMLKGVTNHWLIGVLGAYGLCNLLGNAVFGWLGNIRGARFAVLSAQVTEVLTLALFVVSLRSLPLPLIIAIALLFGFTQAYIPDLKALASHVAGSLRGLSLALNNTAMYGGLLAGSAMANHWYRPGAFAGMALAAAAAIMVGFLSMWFGWLLAHSPPQP